MTKFGSDQEPYEFNEIEIIEESLEDPESQSLPTDDIQKNIDLSSTRYASNPKPFQETPPRYFSSIPYEKLSKREKRKILRMEKAIQRKKFHYEYKAEKRRLKAELRAERRKLRLLKPAKYHWAFFMSFSLIGLGLSFMVDGPVPLFIGIGVGFLFFVEPLYQKAIQVIKDF